MKKIESVRIFNVPDNFKDEEDIGPGLLIVPIPMPIDEADIIQLGDAIRATVQAFEGSAP